MTLTETAAPAAPPAGTPKLPRKFDWGTLLVEGRALIGLVVIMIVFSSLSPYFLQVDNLILMTRHVAMNAILALGMLLVILNGGIDLSVGSVVGLSGVMTGFLLQGADIPWTDITAFPKVWVLVVLAIAVGSLAGLVNGIAVTRWGVAPFIATLGMLYIARGIGLLMTNGIPISDPIKGIEGIGNTGFITILKSRPLGIPLPVWVMVAFAIVFSILLTRTPFGRWLYAMGGNIRAAGLSGVPTKRVETWVYVVSGMCAAVVGVLLTADLEAAVPNAGETYELNAIAAVVIGGAALSGGRGSVRGTMIGAFLVGFLVDGLVLVGVSIFWQQIIKGAVIVFAVALDATQQRLQARSAVRRAAATSLAARSLAGQGQK